MVGTQVIYAQCSEVACQKYNSFLGKKQPLDFSICFASECLSHGNGVDSEGLLQLLSLLKRSLIGTDGKLPLTDGECSFQAAVFIVTTAAQLVICSHLAAPFSFSEVVAGGAPIAVSPTGGPQDEIRERMLGCVEPVAGLGWRDRAEVCVWGGG